MFSPYFSFTREPLSRELAPSEVFVSEGHEELRVRLRHAIETGSLAVVTGQVGSGKSTALRAVMNGLDASRYRYIYLASSQLTPAEFYRSLLYQLKVQPRRGFSENKRLLTQGKAVYGAFCAMAQMELEVISERTKAGMIASKKRGRLSGRKPKNNEKVERALKMYFANEVSINDIIETTGLSKTTLYKYVREYKSNNV